MRLANLFCWAAEHGLSSAPIPDAITTDSTSLGTIAQGDADRAMNLEQPNRQTYKNGKA